jgi:hypothetical protein
MRCARCLCAPMVLFMIPCLAAADTRLIHHEGRCEPAKHSKIQTALQVKLPAARMTYTAKMHCGPFPGEDWAIVAPLFIANPTKQKLYCHCYLAFFDAQNRLVGCCNQATDVNPGAKDLQLGSCIVPGAKGKLLSATRVQAVVYESDGPIGAEPISAKDAADLPGKQRSVIAKLTQTGSDVVTKDSFTELRLRADCSFHEPEKGARNTHLQIKSAAEYDVYLSVTESERLLTRPGKGVEKLPPIWSMTAEIERQQPPKGLASRYHVALLDVKGKLVLCSAPARTFQMDAPKDRLLAARKLEMVVYESPLALRK